MNQPITITESDNKLKLSGLFMKEGLSLNYSYYTREAVIDMVNQINKHVEDVTNGVEGAQYITMNMSHFTDEIDGTVARVISAHYLEKEDGVEAYFEAELLLDLPNAPLVKTLLQNNALAHVSIYGYVPSEENLVPVVDEDGNFKFYKVTKLVLDRIDFTKTPGVVDAKVKIAASRQNKISVVNGVLVADNNNTIGGAMKNTENKDVKTAETKEVETKAQAILLKEEVEKKQKELTETKAKLSELQEQLQEKEKIVTEQQDLLKQAYAKIDSYMKEAFLEELKATKGWSDEILNEVVSEFMNKETFSSKELDADKRYVEFKEFYKPTIETVEKIIENTKKILETKESISEEKPEEVKEETKENTDTNTVSDIISNLL